MHKCKVCHEQWFQRVDCYHGSSHEEIPWQQSSEAQNEEYDPYSIIPGGHVTLFIIEHLFHMRKSRSNTYLSRGAVVAVIVSV